jgi:BMFP domain-containing protein YqiC
MSNIMQYLIQMSDEFRESYDEIKKMHVELMDKVDTLTYRVRELEDRTNINLRNDKKF